MYSKFINITATKPRFILGHVFITPLFLLYKAGFFPASSLRTLSRYMAFWGRDCDQIDDIAHHYAQTVIPKSVRTNALERILWHQSQGDIIVVVSASLDIYLRPWCKTLKIELICNELERNNGKFTGATVLDDCCKDEKSRRIIEQYNLDDYNRIYAYGDTTEDLSMLEIADEKYMNWKKQLNT